MLNVYLLLKLYFYLYGELKSMIKDLLKKIANAVTINGERYENVRSVKVNKNRVYVNGDMVGGSVVTGRVLTIRVEGVLETLDCDGDVECGDIAGSVSANGDVECGDIGGSVSVNGDVSCKNIRGSISCSGDINMSGA